MSAAGVSPGTNLGTSLAPDPGVPGRDVLLDDSLLAARIGRRLAPGLGIEGMERLWAGYAIGKRMRALYEVRAAGGRHLLAASTFRPGRSEVRYEEALTGAVAAGPLVPMLHDPWLEAVFWSFPNDRRLVDLAWAMGTEGASRLVGATVAATELVRWTPQKCAVIRCLGRRGKTLAYLKVYGPGAGELASHAAVLAASDRADPVLRLPRARAGGDRAVLVLEPIEGPSVDTLAHDRRVPGYVAMGAALAGLHHLSVANLPGLGLTDSGQLRRIAGQIGLVRPDAAQLAVSLADHLSAECPDGPVEGEPVTLHGDASPRNAFLTGDGRVTLIDLDDACTGPAASDIGRLLAVLRKRRMAGLLDGREEARLGAAFLDGYAGFRPLPEPAELAWHVAAALFVRAAFSGVRRMRPEGLASLVPTIEEALRALDEPVRRPGPAADARPPAAAVLPDRRGNPPLLMYCQHAQGVGHLVRSLALAGGLADRFSVHLLSGGTWPRGMRPPAGVEVVSLPPLGLDPDGRLFSQDARRTVAMAQRRRRDLILETYRSVRPAVLMVELFPFGRKKFAGEILLLLEEAHTRRRRPLVVSSVRDILIGKGERQASHDERASLLANLYFDAVLVHADPRFARLEDTFTPATPLAVPVEYTGFVTARTPKVAAPGGRPSGPVLLSAGGGGRGPEPMFEGAVEIHARTWHELRRRTSIVAGPFYPEAAFARLGAAVRKLEGIELHRSVPDLVAELGRSSASISQCGYNTATELLLAKVPALVIPVAEGPDGEQLRRARLLERLGAVRVLEPEALDTARLAEEMDALRTFRPSGGGLDTGGVSGTVAVLERLLGLHPAVRSGIRPKQVVETRA